MQAKTQQTAIVPTTESTTAIPEPTARLVEKSFAENTLRNRRQALKHFDGWLQGRQISDGLLAEYITHLFDQGKAPGTISIVVAAVKWYLKHRNGGNSGGNTYHVRDTIGYPQRRVATGGVGNETVSHGVR